jgi:transcriptional regulator with XRE-family HTH domain
MWKCPVDHLLCQIPDLGRRVRLQLLVAVLANLPESARLLPLVRIPGPVWLEEHAFTGDAAAQPAMRPSSKLPNYLRTFRKRTRLSQEEVTFLLGATSGAKVCRYERFVRHPSLLTVFAYEVIFHSPARELFAGLYAKAENDVMVRAKLLLRKLANETPGSATQRKLDAVKAIAGPAMPAPKATP